ncbi:MAG: TIGR02266 family protein [Acidobacteriota bacterium]
MPPTSNELRPRPVRVSIPVRVSFAGEAFQIRDFTANLSAGGAFLPTERTVPVGTRGTLTFRLSQWEEPFTVEAEVAWVANGHEEEDGGEAAPPGLGLRFLDLGDRHRKRLERLVEGIQDGSVVQAIRRSLQEDGKHLVEALRRRPTDQKVIFAVFAKGVEIDALIREGNPVVTLRLLSNPRLGVPHLRRLLEDPRTPARLLLAIKKAGRWLADEELRVLFCAHPRVPFAAALPLLPRLSRPSLLELERRPGLQAALRSRVQALLARRS